MRKHRRPYLYLLFALSVLFVLAACGPATGSGDSEAPDDTGEARTTENEAEEVARPIVETSGAQIEVRAGSEEVTADGLPVGFTTDGRAFIGDASAPVLLEEFSDFQCPYCSRFYEQTLPSLLENEVANGEVVLVFYDFPLTRIHPQAFDAHHATRCAAEEGAAAYWSMHDHLFEAVGEWSGKSNTDELFAGYAAEIGLDTDSFKECMSSDRYNETVQADMEVAVSRGVNSTPSFFLNGSPLTGAQPLAVFQQAIATVKSGEDLATNEQPQQPQQPQEPAPAPTPATITDEFAAEMGDPNAPVKIVEYTDYQCPFCNRHALQTMPTLVSNLVETGRVHYVLKDFPLDSIHPEARTAAVAARCAGEQEAYWEMHHALFENQQAWAGQGSETAEVLVGLATELDLEEADFRSCLESGRYDEAVETNLQEGSRLGISGTPSFFIDGFPVRGAQPYELFEYAVGLAEEGTLADAYAQPAEQAQQQPPPTPAGPVEVKEEGAAFVHGDPAAPVTIVEFTDFQCPFCSRHFQQTYPQILSEYVDAGQVRYVYKDFPLTSIHPQAFAASEAARCAGDQNAYLEMHDVLFSRQSDWAGKSNTTELFTGYASELGLETGPFQECLESGKYEAAVQANLEEGSRLGVRGTPAFFLNGYALTGAQPYETFRQAIGQLLEEAEQ